MRAESAGRCCTSVRSRCGAACLSGLAAPSKRFRENAMKNAAMILGSLLGLCLLAGAQSRPALVLKRTINLPAVTGRFDHMAFDPESNRLFVAATGNHSVEVLNAKTGEQI